MKTFRKYDKCTNFIEQIIEKHIYCKFSESIFFTTLKNPNNKVPNLRGAKIFSDFLENYKLFTFYSSKFK